MGARSRQLRFLTFTLFNLPPQNIAVSRPIIYGNSATPLNGKKVTDPDHTHRWTISVRGVNNEDISYFIKKVAFKLHDTYENPNRG